MTEPSLFPSFFQATVSESTKNKKKKPGMIKCQDYKWRLMPTTPTQGRQCHRRLRRQDAGATP